MKNPVKTVLRLVYEDRPWEHPAPEKIQKFVPRLEWAIAEVLWMCSMMIISVDIVFVPLLLLKYGYVPGYWLNVSPVVAMPVSYLLARVVLKLPARSKRSV